MARHGREDALRVVDLGMVRIRPFRQACPAVRLGRVFWAIRGRGRRCDLWRGRHRHRHDRPIAGRHPGSAQLGQGELFGQRAGDGKRADQTASSGRLGLRLLDDLQLGLDIPQDLGCTRLVRSRHGNGDGGDGAAAGRCRLVLEDCPGELQRLDPCLD